MPVPLNGPSSSDYASSSGLSLTLSSTTPRKDSAAEGGGIMAIWSKLTGALAYLSIGPKREAQPEPEPEPEPESHSNQREDPVEERQDRHYRSTYDNNTRKRRRPTPSNEHDRIPIGQIFSQHPKDVVPSLPSREPSGSDQSNAASPGSFSERPTPSTNVTEPPTDASNGGSLVAFAESKWRDQSASRIVPTSKLAPVSGAEQLRRSLARRDAVQSNQRPRFGAPPRPSSAMSFRSSYAASDRVSKRSQTPSSMRNGNGRGTSRLSVPHESAVNGDRSHNWIDPRQFTPASKVQPDLLRSSVNFRGSVLSNGTSRLNSPNLQATPSRSARIEEQNNKRKKPSWLLQKDPDSKVFDAYGLEKLIKELQDHKVEGFENYTKVQERQKYRDEQIKLFIEGPKKEKLRDISEESLTDLHKFLQHKDQNHEARRVGGCPITPRNLKTLSGSQWLNDEVINAYIHLVKERANTDGKPHLILLNSMFITTLKDHGYSRVARWTKRAGGGGEKNLTLDGIIIPIHRNYHWTLAFINIKKKRFEYYDSLAGSWDPISLLRDYMKQEVGAKYVDADWEDYYLGDETPQQGNGVDCGVFLCKTAEVICRDGILSFEQSDIPKIRRMMQVELLKGDLAAL